MSNSRNNEERQRLMNNLEDEIHQLKAVSGAIIDTLNKESTPLDI